MNDPHEFGVLPDGRSVTAYRLGHPGALQLTVLDLGAIIHRLELPGPGGEPINVALGLPSVPDYLDSDAYFGAVVGRSANRIADSRFTLDGTSYQLAANEGRTCLHGGLDGFHTRRWEVLASPRADVGERLALRLVSPDGDQGFPGRLEVIATYQVAGPVLTLDLQAVTDAPTVVNLTNHVYLNLAGEGRGSVDEHRLVVDADEYLPVDEHGIPLGSLAPVAGTPFDLREPRPVGAAARGDHEQVGLVGGIDHSFQLRGPAAGGGLRRAAALSDPASGRGLELWTDQAALQVYTGNALSGDVVGTSGRRYRQGDGIALETQVHPDAMNHPRLTSPVLRPGQRYAARTQWRFTW